MKGQAPCGTPGIGVRRELVKFDLMYYTVHRQWPILPCMMPAALDAARSAGTLVSGVGSRLRCLWPPAATRGVALFSARARSQPGWGQAWFAPRAYSPGGSGGHIRTGSRSGSSGTRRRRRTRSPSRSRRRRRRRSRAWRIRRRRSGARDGRSRSRTRSRRRESRSPSRSWSLRRGALLSGRGDGSAHHLQPPNAPTAAAALR